MANITLKIEDGLLKNARQLAFQKKNFYKCYRQEKA